MNEEKFFNFDPDIKKTIAYNIRKYRKIKGYTQEQLALYAELSYDFVRRIETMKGKSGFSVETIYRIATVLEIPIDYLTKKENELIETK